VDLIGASANGPLWGAVCRCGRDDEDDVARVARVLLPRRGPGLVTIRDRKAEKKSAGGLDSTPPNVPNVVHRRDHATGNRSLKMASDRKKVSERDYIDVNGKPVAKMEDATGSRYSLGTMQGDKFVVAKSWDLQFGESGRDTTMYGILGFHTKLGNVANTVLNDKDAPGTVDDAVVAINEFTAGTANGDWATAGGGIGAPKYDPAIVAQAIANAKGESDPKPYFAKCQGRVNSKGEPVVQAADGTWPKGAIGYSAYAMRNPKVRQQYETLAPATTGVDLSNL